MIPRLPFRNRAFAAAAAVVVALAAAGPADAGALPRLEADSLGGTHVVLPTDAAGKPIVLVLAFTPESQDDVTSWSRKLHADGVANAASIYVVVVADRMAGIMRGRVRKKVEAAAAGTDEQRRNNVLITFDGTGWRDLTPPGDKKTAGIVICARDGSVVYAKREPLTTANLASVEQAAK